MTANEGSTPRGDDDPSTQDDALSLHTIADADIYAAQEQEDADFALALALEEQESQRYARTQSILQGHDPNRVAEPPSAETNTAPPYRDDPDATATDEEHAAGLPLYRDDPDAPADTETGSDEAETVTAKRSRAFLRIVRKLFSTWLCCAMWSTITTIVIVVVVLGILALTGTRGKNPKEAAWLDSKSKDFQLKLWKLYPALESDTTEECKDAWRTGMETQSLGCHRMILSSAWDNGDADEVNAEEADPFYYSAAMCTSTCRGGLQRMAASLAKSCKVRTDRFDLGNYGKNGKAYFEKRRIEEGPAHVGKNLLERYNRFCERPKWGRERASGWGTCAAEMWRNWGIVDGINEAHLRGLDQFLEQTSVAKTIPGKTETVEIWEWSPSGETGTSTVTTPDRKVGPAPGETYCSSCVLNWLERKMASFDFGLIRDPRSGEVLGLSEFRDKMSSAISRCSNGNGVLRRFVQKWEDLDEWCSNGSCNVDKPEFSDVTLAVLHGWSKDDNGPRGLQNALERKEAPKQVLQGFQILYDAMMEMPCGIGFTEMVAKHEIIPYEHIVARLCSDQCRNAVDRLNAQHGSLFAKLSKAPQYGPIFQYSTKAAELLDKICLSTTPNAILQSSEDLCAPGYAAVGHPEWIFASKNGDYDPPARSEILDVFSKAIGALAARPPQQLLPPTKNLESVHTQTKKLAESACNTCAGRIFIGAEPDWKKTVNEFLDDKDVNGTAYVEAAKKGWLTCGKMYGMQFSEWQKKMMWRRYGLDRYD